jgi:integrase
MPLHMDTANWLGSISDELHRRIARCGLISPREVAEKQDLTLGGMTTAYIERRKADMKPWSIKMLKQGRGKLVGFFGEGKAVGEITAAEAMDFKRNLASQHSGAYVAKIVLISRQFFKDAVDRELLVKSPFSKVKAGSQKNPQRQRFISRAVIDKAIEHASDIEWKLIIALARYAGVRVPSEVLALRWTDVYWDQAKVLIRASKTEHHVGKESRLIPLFPEFHPLEQHRMHRFGDRHLHVVADSPIRARFAWSARLRRRCPWSRECPAVFGLCRSARRRCGCGLRG